MGGTKGGRDLAAVMRVVLGQTVVETPIMGKGESR